MLQIGKLITCDICGRTVFLKKTGTKTTDDGYGAKYDVYEEAPDWVFKSDVGHMCPSCASLYDQMIDNFKNGVPMAKELRKFDPNNNPYIDNH